MTQWLGLVSRVVMDQYTERKDKFMWNLSKGSFSVSSLYKYMMEEVNVLDNCASWNLKLDLKIKTFLWYLKRGSY